MRQRLFGMGVSIFLGIFCLGASCQPPPVVVVGRTNYKPKAGEYELIQQARNAKAQKDTEKENKSWNTLLQRFPGSAFRSEALLRLGIIAHEQGRHEAAVEQLEKALRAPLQSSERAEGLFAYGRSLYRLKRYEEALKALEHSYEGLGETQKRAVLPLLIDSAKQSRDVRGEIRWLSEQMPLLPAEQREDLRKKLLQRVDGRLTLASLQNLFSRRGNGMSFPFDYIGFRLARAYFHSGQRNLCQETLKELFGAVQPSHQLYARLQALQTQLNASISQVNPLKIGFIYPQTGPGEGIGRWVRQAVELAKQNYPNEPIQVIEMDSKSLPEYAVKAVDKLVFKHRVAAIFGPILSKTAVAAAHRAQVLGVPMMTISPQEGIPEIGSYIFRNNLTRSQMGKALARYAFKQLNHTRFAVFYPNSAFGRVQVGAFWQEIERLGGQVVSAESYAPTTINFSDLAKKLVGRLHLNHRPGWHKLWRQVNSMGRIRSVTQRRRLYKKLKQGFPPVLDFDAIFVPETFGQLRKIVSSLVQQDIEFKRHYKFWEDQTVEKYKNRNKPLKFIQLLGTNTWYDNRILTLPQVDLQQYVGSVFCVRYFPESRRQIVKKFVQDFSSANLSMFPMLKNNPPIHISAYTYDSAMLMFHIATQSKPKTRDAFRDALLKVRDFPGVTGPLTTHESGNILAPIRFILVHRKGAFHLFHEFKELIH